MNSNLSRSMKKEYDEVMRSCLKYHGGKYFLRKHLLKLTPIHTTYIEPFFGGGQFFFYKPRSPKEIIADINPHLINMWTSIRDCSDELVEVLKKKEYSKESFDWGVAEDSKDPIERAAQTFVRYRQSMGGQGKSWARPSSSRSRRGMPDNISGWLSAIDLIEENSERLQGVEIVCDSAINVLTKYSDAFTFAYLDPPYVHSTRTAKQVYDYEMDDMMHLILIDYIKQCPAMVLLSGYASQMYENLGWTEIQIETKNHAASGRKKRGMVEYLWARYTNYNNGIIMI